MKKELIILSLSLVITACSSTYVIPNSDNTRTIFAHSSTNNEAAKIAVHKAARICTAEEKSLKMIELDSKYQGMNRKQMELVRLAKTVLPRNKTDKPYMPADHMYQATVKFRCVTPS